MFFFFAPWGRLLAVPRKTHTISGTGSSVGLITLVVNDFFDHIRSSPERVSLLRASFLEVYNEQVPPALLQASTVQ